MVSSFSVFPHTFLNSGVPQVLSGKVLTYFSCKEFPEDLSGKNSQCTESAFLNSCAISPTLLQNCSTLSFLVVHEILSPNHHMFETELLLCTNNRGRYLTVGFKKHLIKIRTGVVRKFSEKTASS